MVAVGLALMALPASATRQTERATGTSTTPAIALLSQPAWSPLGSDVPVRVDLAGATPGLEVRAVVHTYVQSRIAFERTLEGERLGSEIGTVAQPVELLPASPEGGRVLTLPLQDPSAPRDPNRLRISLPRTVAAGVYPVEIELRDPERGEVLAGFVTHLVATAPVAEGPLVAEQLRLSWIWRIAANPATRVDGTVTAAFTRSVGFGGRLNRIASLLPAAVGIPIVLAPGPETVATWEAEGRRDSTAAAGSAAIRDAAATHEVLAAPFVPIDGPSLETVGLGTESVHELRVGTSSLDAVLGTRVDPRTTDATPLDAAYLERLRTAGVDRVVVPPSALAPLDDPGQYTPTHPFALENLGQLFAAVETRPELSALLDTAGTPALRAQRFLAGLSVVALEQPNDLRGVVVDTARRWNPDPEVINPVLAGLRENPLIEASSLDELMTTVPPREGEAGPVVRQLVPIAPGPPSVSAIAFTATSRRLDGLASMVGATDPVVERGRDSLLVALTSAWSPATARTRSSARLNHVDNEIHSVANQVIAPDTRTVTLISRRSDIPISILNTTGREVTIRVQLDSEKLEFPDGDARVLTLPSRNTTVRLPVESRASGTFPLRVTITSEDGALNLQQARYTVRSTVVSGVGVILTIGAGLFLAIWWLTHWRRTRRNPLPVAPVPT